MSPATVGTSTRDDAVMDPCMRKGFYAEGLFWVFYSNGTNAGWEFSNDGTTWVGAFTSIGACQRGYYFSIWFDGTHIHYVRYNNRDLYYRRGTPVNDGTITWSAAEQLVYNGSINDEYNQPCIAVDTNGYAWIGVKHDKPDGDDFPVILKNANNDGTWAEHFAYELSAIDDTQWSVCPVPLTGGRVYVIYCQEYNPPRGNLYDGGWGGEEADLADFNIGWHTAFSAVADGDDVHFIYYGNGQYRYNKRTFGVGWGATDVLIQASAPFQSHATLSINTATGALYCFWATSTTDHVYYKKYSDGAWGGLVDWIDESIDDIPWNWLISSLRRDYGGYIGVLYITKNASPYNVRLALLTMPIPPTTSKISGVTDPAEVAGVVAANIAKLKGVDFVP